MKRCNACREEFEGTFSFCPIDGNLLSEVLQPGVSEYSPTLIREDTLVQRLLCEARFLFDRGRQAWPEIKANPIAFFLSQLRLLKVATRRFMAQPYVMRSALTAMVIISLMVGLVLLLEGRRARTARVDNPEDDLIPTAIINFQDQREDNSKPGVGAGEQGRVGFDRGRGEGSGPKPAKAQGGGGGGDLAELPPSQGKPPHPSVIPAPIPTTYAKVTPALPDAGLNIDPVLYKDLPFRDYGDPRSKSLTPSNGPGTGGGIGTNQGTGIGDGKGSGFGRGNDGNMGDGNNSPGCCGKGGGPGGNNPDDEMNRVFPVRDVTTRARVLSKPEPQYTEEARKTGINGTVILSVVFSRDGQVTNIRAVQSLCCGLTEKAIAAARQIRFAPATRNGRLVSTYMQLEYNFNLY